MRKLLSSTILVAVMVLLAVGAIWSAEDVNTEYLMKIGDYFDVSYDEVDMIASKNIDIEEVPTIFYMAQLTNKSAEDVYAIIEDGTTSWATFMQQHYIHPSKVLIDIYRYDTPECKSINDKLKNKPLRLVKFDDQDVIVMINYKLIAESNNINYSALINKRDELNGNKRSFVDISHLSYDPNEFAQSESNK